MLTEDEVVQSVRDDIMRARELLGKALESMSKPNKDYKKCWGYLNIANHHSRNAENMCFDKASWER